jgi:hypothetical protein
LLLIRVDGRAEGVQPSYAFVFGGFDDLLLDRGSVKKRGLKATTDGEAIEEATRLYAKASNLRLKKPDLRLGPHGTTRVVAVWEFQET